MALTRAELIEQNEILQDTLDKVQETVESEDLDDDEKVEAIAEALDEIEDETVEA